MKTQDILFKWFNIVDESFSNYLNDFLCLYLIDSNIISTFPRHNSGAHNVYMIPKKDLYNHIGIDISHNKLRYDAPLTCNHNSFHMSARYLFNVCHKKEDYLFLWLFLLLRKHERNNFMHFKPFHSDFSDVYIELSHYFYNNQYNFRFGNAYNILPLMNELNFTYEHNKPIDFYLYEFQSQMNYVKATNFMVLLNEPL